MMKLSLTTVTDLLKKRMTDFRLAGYAPEIGGGGPHISLQNLFVSQCDHRVHFRRAASWDIAR